MQVTEKHLTKRLEKLQQELLQARANVNAIEGAIQDTYYWIEVLKADMTEEELFDQIQTQVNDNKEPRESGDGESS